MDQTSKSMGRFGKLERGSKTTLFVETIFRGIFLFIIT